MKVKKRTSRKLGASRLVQILFIAFFLFAPYRLIAQNATVSISVKQVSLKELLAEIEKKSDIRFSYIDENLNNERDITLSVRNESIESLLSKILPGKGLDFLKTGNTIAIRKINTLSDNVKKKITGKVLDEQGTPIVGATIMEKGTTNGTVSDYNGDFNLDINPDSEILISYIGYNTLALPGNNNQTIQLREDIKVLEEIVVVGYGTMRKSDVNAAIATVKPDDLVKMSSTDVSGMLMGKAAGLTVRQNSAQPGGGISILIRGAASVGAGNEPLYVIDGFPVVNAGVSPGSGNQWNAGSRSLLNDLNANDIASIEILKDASATAIYGARAANGVVLITTKRGVTGKTKVEYSFNTSIQNIISKPELLDAQAFMMEQEKYNRELFLQNNRMYPYGDANPESMVYIPKYSQEEINQAGAGTNWYDLVTQTGHINQHNLTITSGSENIKSLFSFNYFDHEGVVKTSGLERYTLRYNFDQKITNWWDYGVSTMATMVNEKNATLGDGRDASAGIIESALNYSPLVKPQRLPDGKWVEDSQQALLNHPLSYLDIHDNTRNLRFLVSAFSNVHFIKDVFWLKASGGTDIRDGKRQNYYPQTTRYGSQVGGDANINSIRRMDYLFDVVLNFQKIFNGRHRLLSLVGYSYQQQNDEGNYTNAKRFSTDNLLWHNLGAGEETPIVSSWTSRHVIASYFTRLQYSLDDKYLFTFTARIDGSDRFGENNRHAFFPSGAFAWRAINEDFIRNVNWLSDLKLRLSAGQVGNENIPNEAASATYRYTGQNYYFDGVEKRGISLTNLGNPNLKWETTTEVNAGFDFGLFKNRVSGSIDLFYKQVKDLLSWRALPHTSIVSGIYSNIGKTESKGIEASLHTINLTGALHWESTLTYTSYRDRWLNRDPKVILRSYQTEKEPLTAIYSFIKDGIKQSGEETPAQPGLVPGQQKYKDINGKDENGNLTGIPDGRLDEADAVFLGTTAPEFTLGFNNYFTYKNFDLNIFLYASAGGYRWPSTKAEHNVYGSYGVQMLRDNYNYLKEIENRWTSTNMDSNMPSGEVSPYDNYGGVGNQWEKASFLRLKNLTLGYKIPRFFKPEWGYDIRIFAAGENLFTVTGYGGFDPEVEVERASYPQQRTFSLGVDIKF